MPVPTKFIPLLFVLFNACAPDNGQVGEETVFCEVYASESLQPQQNSALGFSPATISSFVSGMHNGTLRWASAEEGDFSITMEFTGTANFLSRAFGGEPSDDGIEPQFDLGCPDVVDLEMMVTLVSNDGRLNESWLVHLLAPSSVEASFSRELDELAGSLDIVSFAPSDDAVRYSVNVDVAFQDGSLPGSPVSGRIVGQSENQDTGDTVSATSFDIASFEF